ncbi:MAG: hypothetical protein CMJ32_10850 [Phycisphaerae bacterium]|nr:hypothetical protein [Phycisphaerae bacterium]
MIDKIQCLNWCCHSRLLASSQIDSNQSKIKNVYLPILIYIPGQIRTSFSELTSSKYQIKNCYFTVKVNIT